MSPADNTGVSRETSGPREPVYARLAFTPSALATLRLYADILASDGIDRGLIGPREVGRLWDRHLLNSAAIIDEVPPNAYLCDIGSGAGLPGLVLAIARPDIHVCLVEPLLRRASFLSEVADRMSLKNVEVIRSRAEELHGSRMFDIVTARAVAPLERLLGWSMPLVKPDGLFVAMKGQSVETELAACDDVVRHLGCAEPEVRALVQPDGVLETTVVRVSW